MKSTMPMELPGKVWRRALWPNAAAWITAPILLASLSAGCGTNAQPAQPLSPEAFATPQIADRGLGSPLDRPGSIPYDNNRGVQSPSLPQSSAPVQVGRTVRESVKSPDAEARQEAANLSGRAPASAETSPLAEASAASTTGGAGAGPATRGAESYGWWYPIGCVLMEINGTAIFSDKVISAIEKPLAAEAKKGGLPRFRQIASSLFENQIHVYERDELEFASAERSLEAEDEEMARGMTVQWRQKKITEAGGSPEMARRRAAADGWDFEKQVEQQFRLHLVQIYYQKRIIPLIQVTAADMRVYYDLHKVTEFTTHGQAKFRVIKIDPNDPSHPGREDALSFAQQVHKRASSEDFADLARSSNDEPAWRASGGVVGGRDGFVQKDAFRVKELEEAVWKVQPGQVTDVVSGSDGCFYLAKLEQLTEDKVEDFDSLEVQDKIRDTLRSQQFATLREKHVGDLIKDAITRRNDDMIQQTLDAIIQQYPLWESAK